MLNSKGVYILDWYRLVIVELINENKGACSIGSTLVEPGQTLRVDVDDDQIKLWETLLTVNPVDEEKSATTKAKTTKAEITDTDKD